jgi:MFS family permease
MNPTATAAGSNSSLQPAEMPHKGPLARSSQEAEGSHPLRESSLTHDEIHRDIVYMQGPRLWLSMTLVALLLFLTTVETFIATTSLVAISKDFERFDNVGWVLTGYTLGYVPVIIICAKLSDIFGRKIVLLVCIFLFTAFSGGCAAAQTMTQLIALRGLQGVGGGSCFALATIVTVELVPSAKLGPVVARLGVAIVMAMVLGPIIGGAISQNTTWRWIFLIK